MRVFNEPEYLDMIQEDGLSWEEIIARPSFKHNRLFRMTPSINKQSIKDALFGQGEILGALIYYRELEQLLLSTQGHDPTKSKAHVITTIEEYAHAKAALRELETILNRYEWDVDAGDANETLGRLTLPLTGVAPGKEGLFSAHPPDYLT
ncbi:uncharacterized protein BO97DRAFT_423507 [Aspergillus homomorphus CBS 101889]|uniref:Uncharacterized protein n=1 Tax=Aspergillus homomorphus (strain CBS 101889) TaxID=1450537 RepID=A0A395I3G6_ASPHC|nr:hypothetical protein BO97DRAFT_423507 [Aspergillus homomorphus CBS 101889]RAL13728.1 hypothetical protein BO97DRAFT_423507 [Aspergillus homomorphus CBS 101889]